MRRCHGIVRDILVQFSTFLFDKRSDKSPCKQRRWPRHGRPAYGPVGKLSRSTISICRLDSKDSASSTTSVLFVVSLSDASESEPLVQFEVKTAQNFVWQGKLGEVYRYAFDNSPDTQPSSALSLQGNSITMPIPGDGIYYFHLQLAAGGPIAHYRIQADNTPPEILSMRLSEDSVVAGDVVRFSIRCP